MSVMCLLRAPNIMRMIVVSPSFNISMLPRCLEKDCTNAFNAMANDDFLNFRKQFKKNGNGNNE